MSFNYNLFSLFLDNFNYFLLLTFVFYIAFITLRYKNRTSDIINTSTFEKFQKYLDFYFYVNNLKITIFFSFLYVFFTLLLFLILRSFLLYNYNIFVIDKIDISTASITLNQNVLILLLFKYITFLLFLKSYILLLKELLFKYITQLHIYLYAKFYTYFTFYFFILENPINDFLTKIYIILQYITTTITDESEFSFYTNFPYFENPRWVTFYDYLKKHANSYPKINKFFLFLYYKIDVCNMWINYFLIKIPLICLILTFFFELLHNNLHYTFYMIFVCFLIHEFVSLRTFFSSNIFQGLSDITYYFYKNAHPYEKQRYSIQNNINIENIRISRQNANLYNAYSDNRQNYLENFNRFPDIENKPDQRMRVSNRNINFFTWRLSINVILLIINGYIITQIKHYIILFMGFNITYIFPFILLLNNVLLFYFSDKIFEINLHKENKGKKGLYYYRMLYLLHVILNIFLIYIMLIKPTLYFLISELLINNILIIRKIYTLKEKQEYLEKYLAFYINIIKKEFPNVEYLYTILKKIKLNTLLDKQTTLNEIRELVVAITKKFIRKEKKLEAYINLIEETLSRPYFTFAKYIADKICKNISIYTWVSKMIEYGIIIDPNLIQLNKYLNRNNQKRSVYKAIITYYINYLFGRKKPDAGPIINSQPRNTINQRQEHPMIVVHPFLCVFIPTILILCHRIFF